MRIVLSFICFFLLVLSNANAQKKDAGQRELELLRQELNYRTSSEFSDTTAMITSLLAKLSLSPKDTFALKHLCTLYFAKNNIKSALVAGKRYMDIVPDDTEVLKICAVAYHLSMKYNESLLIYTELFYRTKLAEFKYRAAEIEYEMFRQQECLKTIEECMILPEVYKAFVQLNDKVGNPSQIVPLRAACFNLMGQVYIDAKNWGKAKESFQEALKLFPDFKLAKENLSAPAFR